MNHTPTVRVEEVTKDTLDEGLRIRNTIFPIITSDDWNSGGRSTGAIAYFGEEAVGFIPMYLREVQIDPHVSMIAAYENSVGTKEDYRGQGIGGKMIEGAVDFLEGKADALYVYRSDERSAGYRFYEKTGHIDLLHTRTFQSDLSFAKRHRNVTLVTNQSVIHAKQDKLLQLFTETYDGYGGFPKRHAQYWKMAMQSPYYAGRPADFLLFELSENNETIAYLLASRELKPFRKSAVNRLNILEMAAIAANPDLVKELLEAACAYAQDAGLDGLTSIMGDEGPFLPLLRSLNFSSSRRGMQVMARVIDHQKLFEKLWGSRLQLPDIELRVWTPQRELVLLPCKNAACKGDTVTVEMKEESLTKWMMGRLNLSARLREGSVTMHGGNEQMIHALAEAIPCRPWEYFHLDYC